MPVQDKRYWIAGAAAAAGLIVLAAWFMAIGPQLSSASALHDQANTARQQNTLAEARIATLKRQDAKRSQLTASLRAAVAALPYDSGLSAFTRQLSKQATANRIELTSIAVGSIASTGATGGVSAIPITLLSVGSSKNQLAFLQAVRVTGPRRALITSTQLTPASGSASASIDASSTMTIQLTVFTAPLSPQAQTQLEALLRGDAAK